MEGELQLRRDNLSGEKRSQRTKKKRKRKRKGKEEEEREKKKERSARTMDRFQDRRKSLVKTKSATFKAIPLSLSRELESQGRQAGRWVDSDRSPLPSLPDWIPLVLENCSFLSWKSYATKAYVFFFFFFFFFHSFLFPLAASLRRLDVKYSRGKSVIAVVGLDNRGPFHVQLQFPATSGDGIESVAPLLG